MKTLILLLSVLTVSATAQTTSPVVASVIETVIPGAGFLSAGDTPTALISWLGTAALLAARDNAIRKGKPEAPWNAYILAFRLTSVLGAGHKVSLNIQPRGFSLGLSIPIAKPQAITKGA